MIGNGSIVAAAPDRMSSEKEISERECWLEKNEIGIKEKLGNKFRQIHKRGINSSL